MTMRKPGIVRAAIANVFGLGLGYVYLGRMRLAFVLFAAVLSLFAVAGWSRLILEPSAIYFIAGAALLTGLFPIVHCATIALREREAPTRRYNRWWFYVLWIAASWLLSNLLIQSRATLFGFEPFRIPATSMSPTIDQGDFIMTDTWHFDRVPPRHGDLVVFGLPHDPQIKYVKRIVGLPGDLIEIRDDVLYRNGEAIEENYIPLTPDTSRASRNFGPVETPPEHFFMLGDNRHRSKDSRYIGAINRNLLHGRVVHRWFAYADGILWNRFPASLLENDNNGD